ncbi:MAG: hypothetical protein D6751_08045 [Deltaproteobacteria bacterium]|nr:MAG: hypothetical protein D6751_08045 [Deltaproteobacteria bacterium]
MLYDAALCPTYGFGHLQTMKKVFSLTILLLLVVPALISGCRDSAYRGQPNLLIPPRVAAPETFAELQDLFLQLDYDLTTLRQGVPPLVLERLPEDMAAIRLPAEKKRLFYLALLPMALMLNEEIRLERKQLAAILDLAERGEKLSETDRAFLTSLRQRYRVKGDPLVDGSVRDELLRRVDTIPVDLILAQAANESAYGTSRFSRLANNLFGEWTFTRGTGLVPENRPDGATYEVRVFASLYESLKSYARNINSHWAYESLRLRREQLRASGKSPSGFELASGLHLYSTRRQAYVEDIRRLIRGHGLARLAEAELRPILNRRNYSRQPELVASLQ